MDIYVDGSSRGNPGPSAIGVIVFTCGDNEHPIYEYAKYIGTTTNNIAEYEALIHALAWIMQTRPSQATIHTDSELVYKQIIGTYKTRNERMAIQLKRVKQLIGSLDAIAFRLVPRENNKRANRLAQKASQKRSVNRPTFKQEFLL
ncbi:ribonuclease HI family protein [candidate division WOR-3 bacterium]|nr:ribonuclease HI family protein [candidate division WOR-3 bacterium]